MPDQNSQPLLTPEQEHEVEHRTSVRAKEVHEAIRRDGEEELSRTASALAWSGTAAGLAMGVSLLAEAVLRSHLPETEWRTLVTKIGYPVGFLIVITGKQQLFTENTLTPVIPAMHNRDLSTLVRVARLWSIVLLANLMGAHLFAWAFATASVLPADLQHSMLETAKEATSVDPWTAFIRAIPAGWLIALVVWLRAATDSGEITIIFVLTYLISVAGFTHSIAGSIEYLYVVIAGQASWPAFFRDYCIPVALGNIVGGVVVTAAMNHAQVAADTK